MTGNTFPMAVFKVTQDTRVRLDTMDIPDTQGTQERQVLRVL
jgi:hypothetical protein